MTSQFTSTMGAPLSLEESSAIADEWSALLGLVDFTPMEPVDPIAMLNYCNDIQMAIYALRKTIHLGWSSANARRFTSVPKALTKPHHRLTQADIDEAMAILKSLGACNDQQT